MEVKVHIQGHAFIVALLLVMQGQRSSCDRGYEIKIGECAGPDMKGYDLSLKNCAAVCEDTESCYSFTYLVETRRPFSPDRCRIGKQACEQTSTKRWMTLLTYIKSGPPGDRKSSSTATKLGFMVEVGDCVGYKFGSDSNKSLDECASACWESDSCLAFSYVIEPVDTGARCRPKNAICDALQKEDGKTILTFRKTNADGTDLTPKTDVEGYSKNRGVCLHNNLSNMRVGLSQCSDACKINAHCRSFVYVFKTKKPWTHARCWLKSNKCSNTILESDMVVYTYTKDESSVLNGTSEETGAGEKESSVLSDTSEETGAGKIESSVLSDTSEETGAGKIESSVLSDTSEKTGAGKKDGSGRDEFEDEVSGNIDTTGYERRNGVCLGNNVYSGRESFSACATSCTRKTDCLSFVYVFDSTVAWTHPRCWMKNSDCKEIVPKESLKVYTYTKSSSGIGKTRVKNSVRNYISIRGYCVGAYPTFKATFKRCSERCSQSRYCRAYNIVWRRYPGAASLYQKKVPTYCGFMSHICNRIVQLTKYHSYHFIKKDVCPVCHNGGRCIKNKCLCAHGYTGKSCNVKIMPCQRKPCKNGAKCINLKGNNFKCKCPEGFSGKMCQTNINECAKSPCLNGGTCLDLINKYECKCITGFQGLRCEFSSCKNVSCQNGGSCVALKGQWTCSCPSVYSGSFCESKIDACKSKPCMNGGSCKTLENGFQCDCKTMYTGKQCQDKINHCTSNPCRNSGKCLNKDDGYECKCMPGFKGQRCEVEINECKDQPCKNKGICVDRTNGFDCQCLTGFAGKRCEININECSSNPCKNTATCVDKVNGYECKCGDGFAGENCEKKVETCNQCLNGGTCTLHKGKVLCICPKGFKGHHCQKDVNECLSNPCLNGGECENTVGSFKCICKPGFIGDTCSLKSKECEGHPCKNGGTCVNENSAYRYSCTCMAGYTGRNCEIDIDECAGKPCGKYGVCMDGINTFKCKCNLGYTGKKCNVDIDECLSNPCLNGGTCTDEVGGYKCTCPQGFTGKYCDEKDKNCPENYCKNGGECTAKDNLYSCKCKVGFTGSKCDTAIDRKLSTLLTLTKIAVSTSKATSVTEMPPTTSIPVTEKSLPTNTLSTSDTKVDVTSVGNVSSLHVSSILPAVTILPSSTEVTNATSKKASDNVVPKTEKTVAINKTVTKTISLQGPLTAMKKNESGVIVIYKSNMSAQAIFPLLTAMPLSNVSMNASTKTPLVELVRMTSKSGVVKPVQVSTAKMVTAKTATNLDQRSLVNGKSLDHLWEKPEKSKLDSMEASAFGDVGGLDTRPLLSNGEVAALAGGLAALLLLLGMVLICVLDRRNHVGLINLKGGKQYDPLSQEGDSEQEEEEDEEQKGEEDEEQTGEEDFEPQNKSNNAARRRRLMQYKAGAYRPQEVAKMLSGSSGDVPEAVTSDED